MIQTPAAAELGAAATGPWRRRRGVLPSDQAAPLAAVQPKVGWMPLGHSESCSSGCCLSAQSVSRKAASVICLPGVAVAATPGPGRHSSTAMTCGGPGLRVNLKSLSRKLELPAAVRLGGGHSASGAYFQSPYQSQTRKKVFDLEVVAPHGPGALPGVSELQVGPSVYGISSRFR